MRTPEAGYVFDRFRLSADGTLLVRDGAAVPLAPKVLQTLLVLVEHAGEVVKKADLIQAVWPNSFVEETGLTRNISLLRQALDDDDQRFVVTVARIGYRFAGSVERCQRGAAPATREARGQRHQLIVGRDRELHALRNALEGARSGRGGLLAVTGEPGIGKTTIVDRFLQEVAGTCRIGTGRCSERLAGAESHLPILEALDELTADPAVREALRRTGRTWARYLAPEFDGQAPGLDASELGVATNPERLMRELTIFLEDTARHQPLVIFIDDLHWADLSTIDVLAHLAPRLGRMRLLLVVTYRQHELLQTKHPFARLRGDLIARRQLDEVQVSMLGLDAVREYVQSAFGNVPVTAELAALVLQKTEGNPLFMRDLVRYCQEEGLPAGARPPASDVPQSLRGLIDRTLQTLHPTTRQLLSIAAVQGYEFDSATVARVGGAAAADVEERLRSADEVHALVTLQREHELPDGTFSLMYRFVHVLYQNALYGSIAPTRRIGWARQIAEALSVSHASVTDTIAAQLAVLFETGREFWQASYYFLVTARNALRLFAFAQSSELASRGLHCLQSMGSAERRDRSQRELDLTFARLVPLATLQGYASAEVAQLTQRVLELAEELGDRTAAAAALSATWIVCMVRGECLAAKEAGTRLASIARVANNDVLLINANMHAQIACHHLGEFQEAQEYAAEVRALAPRACPAERITSILDPVVAPRACPAERITSILDPVVASLAESSRNRWITGYLARSLADCNAGVALGRELRHPDSLAFAWVFHAWIHGYRGDWMTCIASAETGMAIAREAGSVQTLAWNRCVRGWALAHVGEFETGLSELSAGIDASKAIFGQIALPQFIAMMAEVLLLRTQPAAAEAWLMRAIDFQNSHDDRYFAAEVYRLAAVCLAARGETEGARSHLDKALDISQSQGATLFELRAALTIAEFGVHDAHAAVRAVMARFPEPENWPEIQTARRILC
jgi:DNA-binding winged helix-turn-helix (wHTH) protein/tetratricopeptide (TPR) repeat protein